jgi:hypothetical protein
MVFTAGLSVFLLRRAGGYFWYGATTLWALGGIAYANLYDLPNRGIAALAAGLAVLIVAALVWPVRRVVPTA